MATNTALTAVKNRRPIVNDVYNKIKSNNICIALADCNKFTKDDILDEKINKEKLI